MLNYTPSPTELFYNFDFYLYNFVQNLKKNIIQKEYTQILALNFGCFFTYLSKT
ncbi:hypothetical protein SAMN05444484_10715 [Flavobacterium chilense]|uniref:Uncharacterized protein n=1 Tax=Flavobacterium chilense TaxID=946677 RepID=A0A1M7JS99_9FLAO|nr:hypothetical protein SAMN05444484_10715 [Flavobacterium chilense]